MATSTPAPPGTNASEEPPSGEPAKPSKPVTRAEYRPDIDGIRGVAAIMVMGFHAEVPGFEGGYIGLDLFFVVSGYVIAGLLMFEHQRTGSIRWGAFYARRARRLIPAKATMLLGVLVLSYFVAAPTAQQQTAKSATAAAAFVSNFFFWQEADVDYFGHEPGTGVLLHTWSLSVEEQFYIALPFAILVAWLLAKALRVPTMRSLLFTSVALGLASVWLAITWADSNPQAAYYLPITRAFEFLIGVALALVVRRVRPARDVREVMGLAGVAVAAYVIWQPMPTDGYPSYWALVPCAAAALVVWAGVGGPTVVTRLLSTPFLVVLGLLSYGWYLWHWPLLVLGETVNLSTPPLVVRVVLILAGLGMAYLSYRYVEGLFYKRSGAATRVDWRSAKVIVSGVGAMAAVAGLASGAVAVAEDRASSPYWESVSEQLNDIPEMPDECLEDAAIPEKPQKCFLVPFEKDRPTVVLWGDSHAWMYIPAIKAASRKQDVNLVTFVMGACPPFSAGAEVEHPCELHNKRALRFVERLAGRKPPVRVIMSATWQTYLSEFTSQGLLERAPAAASPEYVAAMARFFKEGNERLFDELGEVGVPVDVVGPTPIIPRSAPLCEAQFRPYSCDVDRERAIQDEDEHVAWIKQQMKALPESSRYIDAVKALCDVDTCFAEADGVVNYFDDNHVSAQAARQLQRFFEPSIRTLG